MSIRSPFPGMDPFLEHYWRDVHQRFVMYACDQIQPQLPHALVDAGRDLDVFDADHGEGGQ